MLLMTIILSILALGLILCALFMYRNNKVLNFRLYINDMSSSYEQNCINKGIYNDPLLFVSMLQQVSYNEMLYKFWIPLKLKYWYSEEIINKLLYNVEN